MTAALPEEPFRTIVEKHNQFRRDHCASPLTWSPRVAAMAQNWADRLKTDGCRIAHSGDDSLGENIFFGGPPGAIDLSRGVDTWYGEIGKYDYDAPGFSPQTGHFTQVVWRESKEIGCGVATCIEGDIMVCNYSPAGNVHGQYQQNVLDENHCDGE